jgi:TonB family protein
MGRQAYVRLVFDIDDHGVLGNFRVLNASLDIWGDEAIALVSQWRFNPARKGADAVVVPCILDFTWGARDLSIEAVERLRLAMNEPIAGSYQPRPTAIYSPEPPYTAEARAAHLQGTVVISFVVGVDGSPKNLAVAKSLGMGLDESALQTVSTWQFQVPLVNGRPTEIASVVKIDFKLDGN